MSTKLELRISTIDGGEIRLVEDMFSFAICGDNAKPYISIQGLPRNGCPQVRIPRDLINMITLSCKNDPEKENTNA